jgi:hypothetical protein
LWTEHEADAWDAVGFSVRGDWAELDAEDPVLAAPALRLGYGAAVSAAYRAHADLDADALRALERDWRAAAPGRPWAAARHAVRFGWRRGRGVEEKTGGAWGG